MTEPTSRLPAGSHSGSTELVDSLPRSVDNEKVIGVEDTLVQATVTAAPDFPEGGLRAWMTVAGAWLALFATYGYLNAFGVYQDYYTRIYLNNTTPSAVSWIGSFQFFVPLVIGMFAGHLFDIGYFHVMMITGSVLFTFSLFMLSLAKEHQYYQIFLSQGLGMGLGLGMVFTPSVSIPSHYFRRRRGVAVGIALSGSSLGAVIHPILLNNLFNKPSVGFAGGTRADGYLVIGMLVVANLLMRPRLPPRKKGDASTSLMAGLRPLFTDAAYLLTITGSFFCQVSVFFPAFYIQLYAIEHGIDTNLAFYSVAILNGASIIGRIVLNIAADRVGAFNLVIPCSFICAGLMFSMLGITNSASMILVAIFYGIFSGAYLALIVATIGVLARSPAEMGLRVGVALSTNSFAALVGIPIAGALLSKDFHWVRAIIFSAICVAIGTAFFIAGKIALNRGLR
ncbi:hypothetical protein CERSUDRAFT_138483 [Gelatoporia subvermispora B]|uniref:Major facilitator superfamily (MFS) profile domain-containing protein n=1 Tax=Ceriporiopsis subvermispora (strain B) TaxID=914234 RepID=M2RAE4_CERS8|nr:hypothetical protein CERSUDRAFT_138483 [Gelatoporia subvermispora B]